MISPKLNITNQYAGMTVLFCTEKPHVLRFDLVRFMVNKYYVVPFEVSEWDLYRCPIDSLTRCYEISSRVLDKETFSQAG